MAKVVEEGVRTGQFAPGPLEVRMLVFMGALGEALCGWLITGKPELTAALADQPRRHGGRRLALTPGASELDHEPKRCFSLSPSSLAAAPLAAEPLSRAEAVRLALEANPDVKKAEREPASLHGLVDGGAGRRAARDQALRPVDALPRPVAARTAPASTTSRPSSWTSLRPVPASTIWDGYATLKQTLFSFKIGKAIKAARLATQSGDEEIRRVRQAVALLAVQAYNDYVLSIERVRVAKQAVTQKEMQLETTRNRRAAGVATDLDVLRFEVDLENARAQQLCARRAWRS